MLGSAPFPFTSGLPEVPRLGERLVRALVEAGATGLVLPSRPACGRRRPLMTTSSSGRIYGSCCDRNRIQAPHPRDVLDR